MRSLIINQYNHYFPYFCRPKNTKDEATSIFYYFTDFKHINHECTKC